MIGAYAEDVQAVKEMIAEDGETVSWTVQEKTPVDADKPWLGDDATPVTKNPAICFVPAGGGFYNFTQFMKGTEVPKGSQFGLMGAVDFEPKIGDVIERASGPVVVKTVDKVQPAEEVVLYILGLVG